MCEYLVGKTECAMKVTVVGIFAQSAGLNSSEERSECEHLCWDP